MNSRDKINKNETGKAPSGFVRWLPLLSVLFVIIILVAITHAGKGNPRDNADRGGVSDESPAKIGEAAREAGAFRYIEDVGGPHESIEGRASATCRGCHLPQYNDWLSSPHGTALTSEAFIASFRLVDQTISSRACIACHAPQEIDLQPSAVLQDPPDQGITCISCHSKNSRVGQYLLESEREIEYTDSRSPEFCASCHNPTESLLSVLAPDIVDRFGIIGPMGNPYAEWRQSRYSTEGSGYVSCVECHGWNGTGTLHRWPEDVATMVKSAYTVEKIPATNNNRQISIGIRITNTGAGHMFPTGDPGRLLVFDLKIVNAENPDTTIAEQQFNLGVYVDAESNVIDNRLPPDGSIEFLVDITPDITVPPGTLDVKYSVNYMYDPLFAEFLSGIGIEQENTLIDEG